ncbi:MAG: GGDEF domain-containing protein, partial [Proteobacteria bacterium]|nr:GGDEF domain-containing protein [Pseudomonadota bacterium]
NRRRLDSYLEDVRLQCADRGRVMALALIDVDHFKRFNDTHGHQAGDTLLVELAKLLSRNLRRAEDLVARYGGEEFLVVLPGADAGSALEVIESMRRHVEESELGVTVSAGLHVHTPDENTAVEAMIEKADQALYSAKHAGRNRVVTG